MRLEFCTSHELMEELAKRTTIAFAAVCIDSVRDPPTFAELMGSYHLPRDVVADMFRSAADFLDDEDGEYNAE